MMMLTDQDKATLRANHEIEIANIAAHGEAKTFSLVPPCRFVDKPSGIAWLLISLDERDQYPMLSGLSFFGQHVVFFEALKLEDFETGSGWMTCKPERDESFKSSKPLLAYWTKAHAKVA
jgi:hypothetical protein